MRAHNWAATPLGPPETWPQALKTTVRLILTSRHPMFIWWGEALTCLYNDAYSATIGPDRHPSGFGRPGREVWAEIWDVIGPDIELVMAGQGATWHERQLVPITRGDVREDVWWTYGYSPIHDGTLAGGVGGVLAICRDVTANVRAEQAASEEAERLRHFFEQAPGFMALLRGPTHVFELANASYLSLVGRDVLGRTVREALPELEGQGFFELLDQVFMTGVPFNARRRSVMLASGRDGALDQRFMDFVYQPVRGASGAVTGIFVEGSDVTEATLAADALRTREAQQALLLGLVQGQRETRDPHAMMLAASEAVGRHIGADRVGFFEALDDGTLSFTMGWTDGSLGLLTGTLPAERISSAYLALVRRGDVLAFADVQQDPLTGGPVSGGIGARAVIEVPITRFGRCCAGMYVNHAAVREWTAAEIALVREAADQTWDAVERARAASALGDSEGWLRTLVEGIPQLVWRAASPGQWTWASPQWTEYTGLSVEASAGQGWLDALHPGDRAKAMAARKVAEANGMLDVDCRIRHGGSGHYHWFQTRASPVRGERGAITEWVGTCTDIEDQMQARETLAERTQELSVANARLCAEAEERERVEEALRHAQKLEAIGKLAAGVAHDFNNILQSVSSGLELVLDDVEAGTPTHEFAELALTSARRGSSLTHHLLSYARKQMLQPRQVDVAAFLSEIHGLLSRTLGQRIAIRVRTGHVLPRIQVDPGQLQTALLNLAINASHAMPGGGTLTLEAREDSEAGQRCVVIAVTDTGVGMDEATLAQAFEPFFTTKGLDGSGLGLSMVQGFAKQSGGEVRIESSPGKGAKVLLQLPAARTASPFDEQQSTPMRLQGSGRILLVDDAADVLAATSMSLKRAGFEVVQASSGDEALEVLAAGERFDILVTDYAMPGMSGVQLIKQARMVQLGLTALIITGFAEVGEADTLPEAVAVLRKPFQRRELVETLLQSMRQAPACA